MGYGAGARSSSCLECWGDSRFDRLGCAGGKGHLRDHRTLYVLPGGGRGGGWVVSLKNFLSSGVCGWAIELSGFLDGRGRKGVGGV